MDVVRILSNAIVEARSFAKLAFLSLEIGVQNGVASSVNETVDDEVPAAFISPRAVDQTQQQISEKVSVLLKNASDTKFFGTLVVQCAVGGDRLSGVRYCRKRVHKDQPAQK